MAARPKANEFEKAFQQLEKIVQRLESEELPLDESLQLFEEGIRLSRFCNQKLEEVVARAIADSPVPVISAVGHETDFTIADLVADLRAPTPSAAAEAAVPDQARVRRELDEARRRLVECTRDRLDGARERLFNTRLDLKESAGRALRGRRERIAGLAGRMHALSPLSVLSRGYAVPQDAAGRVLRRTADFAPGEAFSLRVVDGVVPCRVEEGEA